MRRNGPASGCSQASRPSAASRLVSDGGHSGPNQPSGSAGGPAASVGRGGGASDAVDFDGGGCAVSSAPATTAPTRTSFAVRRLTAHRRFFWPASAAAKHRSEQKPSTAPAYTCTVWPPSRPAPQVAQSSVP